MALATEEELNLLKRTQKLAEEVREVSLGFVMSQSTSLRRDLHDMAHVGQVAGLAKTLQEQKDELAAKGQEAVAQARLVEKLSGLGALASSPPPPLAVLHKAPRIQDSSPATQALSGVNVSADVSTPAGYASHHLLWLYLCTAHPACIGSRLLFLSPTICAVQCLATLLKPMRSSEATSSEATKVANLLLYCTSIRLLMCRTGSKRRLWQP